MDYIHDTADLRKKYHPANSQRVACFHKFIQEIISKEIQVRILLLYPESEIAEKRGHQLFGDPEHYKYLIYRTIGYLETIKEYNPYLKYSYYNQIPVWKMIKTKPLIYVQSVPRFTKTRNEYWLGFHKKQYTLTDGFETLYEKKWEESDQIDINNKTFCKKVEEHKELYSKKNI